MILDFINVLYDREHRLIYVLLTYSVDASSLHPLAMT